MEFWHLSGTVSALSIITLNVVQDSCPRELFFSLCAVLHNRMASCQPPRLHFSCFTETTTFCSKFVMCFESFLFLLVKVYVKDFLMSIFSVIFDDNEWKCMVSIFWNLGFSHNLIKYDRDWARSWAYSLRMQFLK